MRHKEIVNEILANRRVSRDDLRVVPVCDMKRAVDMFDGVKAVNRIAKAIENKEMIVLFGDYDADGGIGTAIGLRSLKKLTDNVAAATNNRFIEGFGMKHESYEKIKDKYPNVKLIVTIDNGTSIDASLAKRVRMDGVDLIVTDHHEAPETISEVFAIVNPKHPKDRTNTQYLCGAAVIWKVMIDVHAKLGSNIDVFNEEVDLVTVATIGDVVPMTRENRTICKIGMEKLRKNPQPALADIIALTSKSDNITEDFIGYNIVPMFNSVSRIEGTIDPVIDLLLSENSNNRITKVMELVGMNRQRKEISKKQEELGMLLAKLECHKDIIIIYSKDFHKGVVGIVAGRVKEAYGKPAIVLNKLDDGTLKGSARSIAGFDIKVALDACADNLISYGGHSLSAGVHLEECNIELLRERLCKQLKVIKPESLGVVESKADVKVRPTDITFELINELKTLEPYGPGFRRPLIEISGFNVYKHFEMGSGEHLKLTDANNLNVIAFRSAEAYKELGKPSRLNIIGFPEINVWKGIESVQFVARDIGKSYKMDLGRFDYTDNSLVELDYMRSLVTGEYVAVRRQTNAQAIYNSDLVYVCKNMKNGRIELCS